MEQPIQPRQVIGRAWVEVDANNILERRTRSGEVPEG